MHNVSKWLTNFLSFIFSRSFLVICKDNSRFKHSSSRSTRSTRSRLSGEVLKKRGKFFHSILLNVLKSSLDSFPRVSLMAWFQKKDRNHCCLFSARQWDSFHVKLTETKVEHKQTLKVNGTVREGWFSPARFLINSSVSDSSLSVSSLSWTLVQKAFKHFNLHVIQQTQWSGGNLWAVRLLLTLELSLHSHCPRSSNLRMNLLCPAGP